MAMAPRVVILVNDPLTHDSRLFKTCRSLRGAGYVVDVFGHQSRRRQLPRHECKDGCDLHRPDAWIPHAWRRRAMWNLQAARFAIRRRPAAILNHRYNTLLPAVIASCATGAPVVYDNRELFGGTNFEQRGWAYRQAFWLYERNLARFCSDVIMASHGRAESWAAKYRCRKPRVVYDCTERYEVAPTDELRREYGLKSSDKLLLYVGGFQEGRGLLPTLEALVQLDPAYHFVILGYGDSFAEQCRARARELGVAERFHVHEPVPSEQVPGYVAGADLCMCLIEPISLSYIHSVPQKFYEALHAGVPLLTNNYPEMRRLVEAHQVGRCVDPTDPAAIALGAREILEGAVSNLEWKRRALAAAEVLTWENEVRELLEAVSQAVAKRTGGWRG